MYFQPEYGDHQTKREESILTKGKCNWSDIAGAEIDKKRATKLKRCDGFVPALFNIKGYSISKEEVKDILLQRRNYFFSWGTILTAIIAATIAWTQTIETKKERVKAEEALRETNKIKESIAKTATALLKISHIIADGSSRFGGMPEEHSNRIKKYQESIKDFIDKDLELEVKKDIQEINEATKKKNNP